MSAFTINLTWTHLEMTQLLLSSLNESHTRQPSEDNSVLMKSYSIVKPTVTESVAHFFPQIQAVLALSITKALNQSMLNEVLSGVVPAYNMQVYKALLNNIGQWGYFLIAGHGLRLKPGFMNYIRNRVAEMLSIM